MTGYDMSNHIWPPVYYDQREAGYQAAQNQYQSVEDKVNEPSHYARFKIQPKTFIMANKLPFAEGNVVKYVCRHDAKDKAQDMLKVINYSISILEETYGIKAHLEID